MKKSIKKTVRQGKTPKGSRFLVVAFLFGGLFLTVAAMLSPHYLRQFAQYSAPPLFGCIHMGAATSTDCGTRMGTSGQVSFSLYGRPVKGDPIVYYNDTLSGSYNYSNTGNQPIAIKAMGIAGGSLSQYYIAVFDPLQGPTTIQPTQNVTIKTSYHQFSAPDPNGDWIVGAGLTDTNDQNLPVETSTKVKVVAACTALRVKPLTDQDKSDVKALCSKDPSNPLCTSKQYCQIFKGGDCPQADVSPDKTGLQCDDAVVLAKPEQDLLEQLCKTYPDADACQDFCGRSIGSSICPVEYVDSAGNTISSTTQTTAKAVAGAHIGPEIADAVDTCASNADCNYTPGETRFYCDLSAGTAAGTCRLKPGITTATPPAPAPAPVAPAPVPAKPAPAKTNPTTGSGKTAGTTSSAASSAKSSKASGTGAKSSTASSKAGTTSSGSKSSSSSKSSSGSSGSSTTSSGSATTKPAGQPKSTTNCKKNPATSQCCASHATPQGNKCVKSGTGSNGKNSGNGGKNPTGGSTSNNNINTGKCSSTGVQFCNNNIGGNGSLTGLLGTLGLRGGPGIKFPIIPPGYAALFSNIVNKLGASLGTTGTTTQPAPGTAIQPAPVQPGTTTTYNVNTLQKAQTGKPNYGYACPSGSTLVYSPSLGSNRCAANAVPATQKCAVNQIYDPVSKVCENYCNAGQHPNPTGQCVAN